MPTKKEIFEKTESLLISTQNKALRYNYSKAKIDNTQQNSKSSLCGERNEAIKRMQQTNTKELRDQA